MSVDGWYAIDNARYNKEHWKLFIIVSLSFLLDGILFSLIPLTLYIISPDEATFIFALSLIAFAVGAVLFGRIGDILGRRRTMILSIAIYSFSTIAYLFFHETFLQLSIIASVINLGIGGEIGAAYAAIAELMPKNLRGRSITLATNMWNIGAALIAGLALIYSQIYTDLSTQINYLILSAIVAVLVVFFARLHMPESPRWLILKGNYDKAVTIVNRITNQKVTLTPLEDKGVGIREAFTKYSFRLLILLILALAQLLTYNMIAYYSPYAPDFVYGYTTVPFIVFAANLGASIGAFILIPLIDKNRKVSTTLSFLGGMLTSLLILLIYNLLPFIFFLIALFLNMIFSEFAWASISTLESELFPTGIRASTVGLITFIANFVNAIIVYLESYITAYSFLLVAFIIWVVGMLASLAWYLRGIESARKALHELLIKG